MDLKKQLQDAAKFVRSKIKIKPETAITLGSGLGALADEVKDAVSIPYEKIPHFPKVKVVGHKGRLVIGTLAGKKVACMQGRFHYYEGHSMQTIVFPIRVLRMIGCEKFIVTNAAGGINPKFKPGDLMLIKDHINLLGHNPLRGENPEFLGERFFDMTFAYDRDYQKKARATAKKQKIKLQEGVYCATLGPSFETPAEIKMLRTIGGTAAGMSTVPEVIAASQMKMRTLGVSCITNMAAGILDQPLGHEEVLETTEKAKVKFKAFIKAMIKQM